MFDVRTWRREGKALNSISTRGRDKTVTGQHGEQKTFSQFAEKDRIQLQQVGKILLAEVEYLLYFQPCL